MSLRNGRDYLPDLGLLLIRCILGSVFIFHGAQKLFGVWDGSGLGGFATTLEALNIPYPPYAAVLAGGAEFLGGIALITGIWMRTATLPLIVTMIVAIVFVHEHTLSIQKQGIEYPLTLAVVLLGLLCSGPGRLWMNLDAVPQRLVRKKRAVTDRVELGAAYATDTVDVVNRLPERAEAAARLSTINRSV